MVSALQHALPLQPLLTTLLYVFVQTRCNSNPESRMRAWQLFFLIASAMPTNKEFIGLVSEYIHSTAQQVGIRRGSWVSVLCWPVHPQQRAAGNDSEGDSLTVLLRWPLIKNLQQLSNTNLRWIW